MKLYHFTSTHHVDKCLQEGIKLGSIPVVEDNSFKLISGYQWLTSNPDFKQEWANTEYSTLPYDRTAHRLTIIIPKTDRKNLYKWQDVCETFNIDEYMNAYGDPENWYVFEGRIKPSWIRSVENK